MTYTALNNRALSASPRTRGMLDAPIDNTTWLRLLRNSPPTAIPGLFHITDFAIPASLIGQGSSALNVDEIGLERPETFEREAIRQGMEYLQSIPETDENREILQKTIARLSAFINGDYGSFGVFDAIVRSPEDYLLGFAAPNRLGLSREVLNALRDRPNLLAEYLFHEGYATLVPEVNKFDHQSRYNGVQRQLFGPENELRNVLRSIINQKSPEASTTRKKGGSLSAMDKLFYDLLRQALENTSLPDWAQHAVANGVARMRPGSFQKLLDWRVVSEDIQRALAEKQVSESHLHRFVGSVIQVWSSLQTWGYQQNEMEFLIARLIPGHIIQKLQLDADLAPGWIPPFVEGRAEFESWIYKAQSIVFVIENIVGGRTNAWYVVHQHGIDHAQEWVEQAKPIVFKIADIVGGPAIAWKIMVAHGIENTEKWVDTGSLVATVLEEHSPNYGRDIDVPGRSLITSEKYFDDALMQMANHYASKGVKNDDVRKTMDAVRKALGDEDARVFVRYWLHLAETREQIKAYTSDSHRVASDADIMLNHLERIVSGPEFSEFHEYACHEIYQTFTGIAMHIEAVAGRDPLHEQRIRIGQLRDRWTVRFNVASPNKSGPIANMFDPMTHEPGLPATKSREPGTDQIGRLQANLNNRHSSLYSGNGPVAHADNDTSDEGSNNRSTSASDQTKTEVRQHQDQSMSAFLDAFKKLIAGDESLVQDTVNRIFADEATLRLLMRVVFKLILFVNPAIREAGFGILIAVSEKISSAPQGIQLSNAGIVISPAAFVIRELTVLCFSEQQTSLGHLREHFPGELMMFRQKHQEVWNTALRLFINRLPDSDFRQLRRSMPQYLEGLWSEKRKFIQDALREEASRRAQQAPTPRPRGPREGAPQAPAGETWGPGSGDALTRWRRPDGRTPIYGPIRAKVKLREVLEGLNGKGELGNRILDVGSAKTVAQYLGFVAPIQKVVAVDVVHDQQETDLSASLGLPIMLLNGDVHYLDRTLASERLHQFLGLSDEAVRFDTIVLSDVLNYVDYRRVLEQCMRYLSPGGRIVIMNMAGAGLGEGMFDARGVKSNEALRNYLTYLGFNVEIAQSGSSDQASNLNEASRDLMICRVATPRLPSPGKGGPTTLRMRHDDGQSDASGMPANPDDLFVERVIAEFEHIPDYGKIVSIIRPAVKALRDALGNDGARRFVDYWRLLFLNQEALRTYTKNVAKVVSDATDMADLLEKLLKAKAFTRAHNFLSHELFTAFANLSGYIESVDGRDPLAEPRRRITALPSRWEERMEDSSATPSRPLGTGEGMSVDWRSLLLARLNPDLPFERVWGNPTHLGATGGMPDLVVPNVIGLAADEGVSLEGKTAVSIGFGDTLDELIEIFRHGSGLSSIIGVDIIGTFVRSVAIEIAERWPDIAQKIRLYHATATEMSAIDDESVALVNANAIELGDDGLKAILEIVRILEPGGFAHIVMDLTTTQNFREIGATIREHLEAAGNLIAFNDSDPRWIHVYFLKQPHSRAYLSAA